MMKLSKNNTAVSAVVAAIAFCVMFLDSPAVSYGSGFMDLELSVKELQQLVAKTSPSLVLVVSYDDCGTLMATGSGFFIDRSGVIIVNASILKGAYSAEVLSSSRQYDNVIILHKDDSLDFALIQVRAADERPLELGFDYDVKQGERVVVIGQSSDMKSTVSEGLVSPVEDKSSKMEIQTTKPLLSFRESKDGPLLSMSGKVIGVMSATIHDSQDINEIPMMPDYQNFKAVRITSIKKFLSMRNNAEHLHPAKSKIWSSLIKRWMQTAAISTFILLYSAGFTKLILIAFIIVLIISAIQWLFIKLKRKV